MRHPLGNREGEGLVEQLESNHIKLFITER